MYQSTRETELLALKQVKQELTEIDRINKEIDKLIENNKQLRSNAEKRATSTINQINANTEYQVRNKIELRHKIKTITSIVILTLIGIVLIVGVTLAFSAYSGQNSELSKALIIHIGFAICLVGCNITIPIVSKYDSDLSEWMWSLIGLIWLGTLGTIIGYIVQIVSHPVLLWFFIPLLLICILFWIGFFFIIHKGDTPSDQETRRIEAAKIADQKAEKENARQLSIALQAQLGSIHPQLKANETTIDNLQLQLKNCRKNIEQLDILCEKDQSLTVVDYLINQMERRRASSIKEALNQYDAEQRTIHLEQVQWEFERQRRNDERIARIKRETDEWLENYRADVHRERMEKIEKDKLRELEEINRKLDN